MNNLLQDLDSCAAVARRLSKNLVIYLHKMNQGKEVEEVRFPLHFSPLIETKCLQISLFGISSS